MEWECFVHPCTVSATRCSCFSNLGSTCLFFKKKKALPLQKTQEVHVMQTFSWKLKEDIEDLPLLVPVCRAAGPSGIKARINSSSPWTTRQQGILPPKAKSALYQLHTNLQHKKRFRVSELRAQHRHCSRVEADDRRERMQHLQFFSPAADLLRKCMLQVKSGLRDTLYEAVNQPAAPSERQIRISVEMAEHWLI